MGSPQIRRSEYPNFASYLDAIAEPIGGAANPALWDEAEQVFVLNPEWVAEQERRGRRPTWVAAYSPSLIRTAFSALPLRDSTRVGSSRR